MSTTVSKFLSHQQAPSLLLRFPRLLFPYFIINGVSVLRMRYARRAIRHALQRIPSPRRVTDAGCGWGDFLFTTGAFTRSEQALGIDVSPSNIALCQRLAEELHRPSLRFLCSDLASAAIPPQQDLILCIGVLMYIAEDEMVMRKFHDALSEDGLLLLYVAVNYRRRTALYRHLAQRPGFEYDEIIGRPQTYTDASIAALLERTGFEVVEQRHSFGTVAATMFEFSAIFEWLYKSGNIVTHILITPFYLLFFPLYHLAMALDHLGRRTTGNGVMITARKRTQGTHRA